jgi:uncharacterized protein YjiK
MNDLPRTFTRCTSLAGLATLVVTCCSSGQTPQFNLANYRHTRTHELSVHEASAVTYNPDRGSLFVIGDEGDVIVEFTCFGTSVATVLLSGFDDTEGLAYVGGGRLAIAEERIQGVSLLAWPADPTPIVTIARSSLPRVTLGPNVGNVGIEGICLDPTSGRYVAVKEKSPQRLVDATIDFPAGTAKTTDLCPPGPLGLADLADIGVLSGVARLAGSPDRDNLLVLSQESARLVEVTRAGVVRSTFDLSGISATIEGVTIDADGVMYLVDETSRLYVLEPCRADFNHSGSPDVQDISDFLAAWFGRCGSEAGLPEGGATADMTGDGLGAQDLFAFIGAWFAGC